MPIFKRILAKTAERTSQESKTTSTPRNSPIFSVSPSISSLVSSEDIQDVIDTDEPNSTATSYSESTVTFDVSKTKRTKTFKWKGYWSSLKPTNPDSLYFKVLNEDTENVANDFFEIYRQDQKTATHFLMQLFVDLCGYKNLSVESEYDFETVNSSQLVNKMSTSLMEQHLKTGKFLFIKYSNFVNSIDRNLSEFINNLIILSFKNEALFDGVFITHVLEFINCMSYSVLRHIRVTGIILAMKFLSAFVTLYSQWLAVCQNQEFESDDTAKKNEEKSTIDNIIDFLYIIFENNCLITDKKCFLVKIKSVEEMVHWMKLFPEIFILKRRCFGRLLKIILDENPHVRFYALKAVEKLVNNKSIEQQIKQRIELCLKVVSSRIVDENNRVVVQAIKIFTAAGDKYPAFVTNNYKLIIINRMFEKNLLIGQAAAQFLVNYLNSNNNKPEEILFSLVKITHLQKAFAERLPFFLELCWDLDLPLKNWQCIVNILLNNEFDFTKRTRLLSILHETVQFTLTGRWSKSRENFIKVTPDHAQDLENIAAVIFPYYENLMIIFQTQKKCLQQITEILLFIVSQEFSLPNELQMFNSVIFLLLKDLFNASTDKDLLRTITKVFYNFCEKQNIDEAKIITKHIHQNYVSSLIEFLNQLTPEFDKELLIKLRETSIKISIIFEDFNLTGILKWDDIFQAWEGRNLKALCYLFVCCKWHLVWRFRDHIKSSTNDNHGDALLFSTCKYFIFECLDILKNGQDNSESYLIFESLCDLYISFEMELKRRRQFSNFFIKITENYEILMNFVENYIIQNEKLDLKKRQNLLLKLVNLIYLDVIPVEQFSTMLQYSELHYKEFKPIFDDIFNQLYINHPALPLLIIHTLTKKYEEILEKCKVVDVTGENTTNLKKLAKAFASKKEVKVSNTLIKLVNMCMTFAFKKKQNYPFLYFTRYFVKMMKPEAKTETRDTLQRLIPKKAKNDDIILLFANSLKS